MAEQKDEVLVTGNENPIKVLATKYKEYQTFFEAWVDNQSLPVAGSIVAATNAITATSVAVFANSLINGFVKPENSLINGFIKPEKSIRMGAFLAKSFPPAFFAVWLGVDSAIYYVMARSRGVEDVKAGMVSGFGSGALSALVIDPLVGGSRIASAGTLGVGFALVYGGVFKLDDYFRNLHKRAATRTTQEELEELSYKRTRAMLSILGLENYEKKFKEGKLTDETLPLLTESNLQELEIPVGSRLVILDYIKRNEIKGKKEDSKDKK